MIVHTQELPYNFMEVWNFDNECIYFGDKDAYWNRIAELPEPIGEQVWRIDVRGYFNKRFFDGTLQKGFVDTTYGAGIIIFKGTFKELLEVETQCHKNGIKVIGSKPYKN